MSSMLFNLLVATKTFFSFFSLFLKVFLAIQLLMENTKLRLVLATPTGASVTVANEETLPLVADKINKVLSIYLLSI